MIRPAPIPADGLWFRVVEAAGSRPLQTHAIVGTGTKTLCGKSARSWRLITEGPLQAETPVTCDRCVSALPRHWPPKRHRKLAYLYEHSRKAPRSLHRAPGAVTVHQYAPILRWTRLPA